MNDTSRLADCSHSSSGDSANSQNNANDPSANHHRPNTLRPSQARSNQRSGGDRSSSGSSSSHLKYGAKNVIELFIPVSVCMAIVVGTMKATNSYSYDSEHIIWYAHMMYTDQSVDTGTRIWQSFANAFILLIFIAIMTSVLIILYKFRCYKIIHGWLIVSSLMLLFIFTLMYITEILKVYNIPMDGYTIALFIWNFGVVGMICIHWKGPLLLQQSYLVMISALMALVFLRCLPDWTIWTVLAIVSVWDLVAVLCPRGPLRILVETAQERNEPIFPALIYSSAMMWEIGTSIFSSAVVTASMADADAKNSQTTKRSHRDIAKNDNNQAPRRKKGSGDGRNRIQNDNKLSSSTTERRNQHPVEIQYDDDQVAPEVSIIQPNLSGLSVSTSANNGWSRAEVRAVSDSRARRSSNEVVLDGVNQLDNESARRSKYREVAVEEEAGEESGVKLGLGDFIFFSVLVGKASSFGDWTVTIACYISILVGLCLTLTLLAVFRKALPALPISIAFGLCTFFLSYFVAVPLASQLSVNQVFI